MKLFRNLGFLLAFLGLVIGFSGCSKNRPINEVPHLQGPQLASPSALTSGVPVTLSNGAEIYLQKRSGKFFFTVEGTFSKESSEPNKVWLEPVDACHLACPY